MLEPNMWFLNGLEGQIEIRNDDLGFDIWTTLGFVDYRRSNITLSSRFSSISQSRRRRSTIVVHIGANVFLKSQSVKWDQNVFLSFQILFLNHICKSVATQHRSFSYLSPYFVLECAMYKVNTYLLMSAMLGNCMGVRIRLQTGFDPVVNWW